MVIVRPPTGFYVESLVALDAGTGAVRWSFGCPSNPAPATYASTSDAPQADHLNLDCQYLDVYPGNVSYNVDLATGVAAVTNG